MAQTLPLARHQLMPRTWPSNMMPLSFRWRKMAAWQVLFLQDVLVEFLDTVFMDRAEGVDHVPIQTQQFCLWKIHC